MCEYHGYILSTGKQAICSDKGDDCFVCKAQPPLISLSDCGFKLGQLELTLQAWPGILKPEKALLWQ